MSRQSVVALLVLIIALALPLVAAAADLEGKVQTVDPNERTITLDNGTKIWLSEAIAVDSVKPGSEVIVSYEERDGKPVATTVTEK